MQSSLDTVKHWVKELQQMGPGDIVIAIAGNKLGKEVISVSSFQVGLQ